MKNKNEYEILYNKIQTVLGRGAVRDWDLGSALHEMNDSGLWKTVPHRVIRGRNYSRFAQYVYGEFRISGAELRRCCRIARAFQRDQVVGWGSYDINLVANVKSPDVRNKFVLEYPKGCKTNPKKPSLEESVRKLSTVQLYAPLKRLRTAKPVSLTDLTFLLEENADLQIHIENSGKKGFKASLLTKTGVLAVGVDESVPTALRNAIAAFKARRVRKAA